MYLPRLPYSIDFEISNYIISSIAVRSHVLTKDKNVRSAPNSTISLTGFSPSCLVSTNSKAILKHNYEE